VIPAVLFTLCAAGADEAPLSLRMEIDDTDVAQGDSVRLDVVLTVRTQQQVEELSLPDVPRGLSVTQERRATSTQVGTVNGVRSVTSEQRFMFVLRADEAGAHRIGEATARLGRTVARAAPVTINVTAANAQVVDEETAGPQPGARFGKDPPAAFLEVSVDKDTVWAGEQVTVTTEVFTQQPLSQWPRLAPLKPAGFFCVPLLGDERPAPLPRSIGGRLYYGYLVNKDALFATTPGAFSILPASVDLVPAGSFFSRSRDVRVTSSKVSITVKPLPSAGRPGPFARGNVGRWELVASVRPPTATPGQPVTLTLVATGRGNVDQLQLPTWDGGGVARVFPPTSRIERTKTSATDTAIGGRVLAEMLVQPLREGTLVIPAFTLVSFDPAANAFTTSTTQSLALPVKGAPSPDAFGPARNGAQTRQLIAIGARPLRAGVRIESPPSEIPVVGGIALAAAGLGAFALGQQRRRRRSSSAGERDAARAARARALVDARTQGDLAALERLVVDALADAFGPTMRSSSTAELEAVLLAARAERTLVNDVVRFISDVEAARYMKGGAPAERERMARMAFALVERIDGGVHGGAR
jgi:hypothetical protein